MGAEIFYINKHSKKVPVSLTLHAVDRFVQRFNLIHPQKKIDYHIAEDTIAELFCKSNRLINLKRQHKYRLKKHGSDTMFFKTNNFTFVVQNAQIVTIEISNDECRYLNHSKIKGGVL